MQTIGGLRLEERDYAGFFHGQCALVQTTNLLDWEIGARLSMVLNGKH